MWSIVVDSLKVSGLTTTCEILICQRFTPLTFAVIVIHGSCSTHLIFNDVDQSLCALDNKVQGSHEGAAQNWKKGSKNMYILGIPIKL